MMKKHKEVFADESMINLEIDSLLLDYYKTEFDHIENYFETLSYSVNNEKERINSLAECLESKGASEDYIADSLEEDSFNLSFFEDNAYNFAIVFLYSECEKLLKQDYEILSGESPRNLFKFKNVNKLFAKEGIGLTFITNYSKLDEIRVLNNCIKHNGYVDKELSAINSTRWIINSKIKLTYKEVQQFLNDVRIFFDNFVSLVDSKNREKIRLLTS